MFEKSLYDLIRGLRNHKGNEREYIQNSLKECRTEIRGSDMDLKATALLKLIYLEMFGHDMSWASFHVLEVMSSQKYLQKRVGYLGAVQSFRTDTEVLMLATNLLKKDLGSASLHTMSLPIITLPHLITPSLAMSVLSDLLPRLTHSSPTIRKKTIVTLYRLALVYPETLRPAWPKIKERLMDESEDPSVTAAIINVVCELGWRRPQDFLPLAPRLFELLVDGGNNWMAIKLIKLFATLTPLEPRLVKKLLPPLTSIIRTTPAMSLLYECINGIIQGGILGGSDDSIGEDEIASLCVSKLRGMIMVEGDPNLKYVALLAFNKIVATHPALVAQQEDVIMDCIDNPDISIRLRALDLVVGMVNIDNLMSIVGRLMKQLRTSPSAPAADGHDTHHTTSGGVDPMADSDDERPEVNIKSQGKESINNVPLPVDYKIDVISRILQMCSSENYGNLVDFDWYIDILIQLVRNAPGADPVATKSSEASDVSEKIGAEIRTVAVKVKAIRSSAARAAESIILGFFNGTLNQAGAGRGALRPVAWIAGEYAPFLSSPEDVLTALIQITKSSSASETSSETLSVCLQAITKIFAFLAGNDQLAWTAERKTMVSLLMARIINTLEPLSTHPNLEVQERAVEFSELLKLAAEAASGQDATTDSTQQDPPLLLTQAIPSLFTGFELNSVASTAQMNVPLPSELDLDQPINPRLNYLLQNVSSVVYEETDQDEFEVYYHKRPIGPTAISNEPAINRLTSNPEDSVPSYQEGSEESYLDPDIVARRRAERLERNKDDPFYIGGNESATGTGSSTPLHNILQNDNGNDVDIDSIPIMKLDLGSSSHIPEQKPKSVRPSRSRQRIQIAADETLAGSGTSTPRNEDSETSLEGHPRLRSTKAKQSLLQVDSSNIGAFSLEEDGSHGARTAIDYERQQREEAEMAKAMQEVERLRLEMQRANERIQAAQGVPPEGTLVKKKAKKKSKPVEGGEEPTKPKKKKKVQEPDEGTSSITEITSSVKKKKPKKKAAIDEGVPEESGEAQKAVPGTNDT